jgi:hypothetical protein
MTRLCIEAACTLYINCSLQFVEETKFTNKLPRSRLIDSVFLDVSQALHRLRGVVAKSLQCKFGSHACVLDPASLVTSSCVDDRMSPQPSRAVAPGA